MILHGDCIEIMGSMRENSVDLIYADPPFNTGRDFGEFTDKWRDGEYFSFMRDALTAAARTLSEKGSMWLHCDPTASHYLKVVMDEILGTSSFRNEIVWRRSAGAKNNSKRFHNESDSILYYALKGATWNAEYRPLSKEVADKWYSKTDENGRRYNADNLTAPGNGGYKYEFLGVVRGWRYPEERMNELLKEGRIVHKTTTPDCRMNVPGYKRYLDESKGALIGNIWTDIKLLGRNNKEKVGYPTQKPTALLERIVKASSDEGDVVLDPFCGSGTTLVAAKRLGRRFVGIDKSMRAVEISQQRIDECRGR